MLDYSQVVTLLKQNQKTWVVTGVAGFIGSHILEQLLFLNQKVVGLDNFFSGYEKNLEDVKSKVGENLWKNFQFVQGDIKNYQVCNEVTQGADYVLHQAALGSVPRSMAEPRLCNEINVDGFLNVLEACRHNKVKRLVYASSSAVYGDNEDETKTEARIGKCLSPYAVSKYVDELYSNNFFKAYGFVSIGLRYFNIFGSRQDPNGAYAAVIPKWIDALLNGRSPIVYGAGDQTRDFCYVENVVQANILAAIQNVDHLNDFVFNVGLGGKTTLMDLLKTLSVSLVAQKNEFLNPTHEEVRQGDIKHSQADISLIKSNLNFSPLFDLQEGLKKTCEWYERFY